MLTTVLLLLALQDASTPPKNAPPPPCPAGLSGLACAADNGHVEPPCQVSVEGHLLYPAYAAAIPHTSVDIIVFPPPPSTVISYTIERFTDTWNQFRVTLPGASPLWEYWIAINAEGMEIGRQKLFAPMECLPGPGIAVDILLHPAIKPWAITEDAVAVEDLARKTPDKVVEAFEKDMGRNSKTSPQEMSAAFQEVVNTAPDYYEANLELGLEYQKAGQRENAIRALTRALELNSASMLAPAALGQYAFEAGDFQAAANLLSEAARLGSKSSDVYYMLGSSYYKLGQLGMADASLMRAIDIPPSIGNAYLQLYNVYMRAQMPGKALTALEAYLNKYPDAKDRDYVRSMADKLRKSLKPNP